MSAMESWLFNFTTTDCYSLLVFILCAMVVHRCGFLFRNIFIFKSQAISYVAMLSETEFAEINRTSIQTQTENLIRKPCETAVTSSESNLKIKRINDELMQVEQHIKELKSHAHCFQRTDTRQQNEIFNSEISKCEHIKLELELQKKEISNLKGLKDQPDLLQNEFFATSEEGKMLMNTQYSKESMCEYKLEKEQNKLLMTAQQISGALEKVIPELEKFQFKLQKLNEADERFSLSRQNQPMERQNCYFGNYHGKPHEKESLSCGYDIRKQMLSKTDTNFAEHTDTDVPRTNYCLKHVHEEKKMSMEIKQEKAKAERQLQMSLCRRDRNKFNYEKAKCMMKRTEEALSIYYQYFNQTHEAFHLREGTCQQFSDATVKKGYEMLKEQCHRSQQLVAQLDKELAVHYEEIMTAHNVLDILEKHALNYFERQELIHSQEFYLVDKMMLLHELIECVERDDQRLSYFLREVNESKKRMAAMVKAVDSIEGQARSLKNSNTERVKAELMKVVKQLQYAKSLDSLRALKDSEYLLSCMTEKTSVKPSQLDQLRLKGEIESILKKCQDWTQQEKTLYIEQLKELEEITASQYNLSEEQSVNAVKDVNQKVPDISEKEEIKEVMNTPVAKIKDHSGSEEKAVNPTLDANSKSLDEEACASEFAVQKDD